MQGETSTAHPPPEGGKIAVQLLWALPYDKNVHAVQQTKGVTSEDEHGSGTSTISYSGMEEPWGEEEPGGEGPRGPHEGNTSGKIGTRGQGIKCWKLQTSETTDSSLSPCDHDSENIGPQDSNTTEELSNEQIDDEARGYPSEICGDRTLLDAKDHAQLPHPAEYSPRLLQAPEDAAEPQFSSVSPGARELSLVFPARCSLPTDQEFPLMMHSLSVLELQDDPDEEEALDSGLPSPGDIFGEITADQLLGTGSRRRGINMTEGVPVPSSEHVAEIVGRQGCKIKALRAKTNTYIKTPIRGEQPVFIVTGRKEDVEMAKLEILTAAEHFSTIRATRNKINGIPGTTQGPPNLLGQTTIQVRVPYRVVGLVVGPKGATIKRIQQNTHTYIVTPSRDKEPVFEVTGMPENVDRAREEIEAHITMRTGSVVDFHPDNDFHSNGTDVCMDLLGGGTGSIWSKVPAPHRGSTGSRNETLHDKSLESPFYGTEDREQGTGSPFRSVLAGNFPLGGETSTGQTPVKLDECEFGLQHLALDLNTPALFWPTFEPSNGQIQNFSGCPAQRRNSGLSGCTTPLLSPTVPDNGIGLEHPLARRIHSDPISSISWLPNQGSFSSFSQSAGYSSSSSLPTSSSVASSSPTDSSSSESQRKSGRDCVVCYESEVIAALVPCGHNLFCMECAIRICERVLPECPACHSPATQAIRIFS